MFNRAWELPMFVIKHLKCIDCERDVYYNATQDLYMCMVCDKDRWTPISEGYNNA